jgi:hypothetical protein
VLEALEIVIDKDMAAVCPNTAHTHLYLETITKPLVVHVFHTVNVFGALDFKNLETPACLYETIRRTTTRDIGRKTMETCLSHWMIIPIGKNVAGLAFHLCSPGHDRESIS